MAPAHQGLEPGQPPGREPHDGLEEQLELAVAQAGADLALQRQGTEGGREGLGRRRIGTEDRRRCRSLHLLEDGHRLAVPRQHHAQAHPQDRIGLRDPVRELFLRDDDEFTVLQGPHGGGARLVIEDRHLADDLAGAAMRQDEVPLRTLEDDLQPTADDQVGGIAHVARREQACTGGQVMMVQGLRLGTRHGRFQAGRSDGPGRTVPVPG